MNCINEIGNVGIYPPCTSDQEIVLRKIFCCKLPTHLIMNVKMIVEGKGMMKMGYSIQQFLYVAFLSIFFSCMCGFFSILFFLRFTKKMECLYDDDDVKGKIVPPLCKPVSCSVHVIYHVLEGKKAFFHVHV